MRVHILVLAILGLALAAGGTAAAGEGKPAGGAILMPANEMKFADVPGFPGVQMAVAEGDPAKGPHHSFLKFAAGFSSPLHTHTPDHYVTVIAGTLVLTVDGKEHRLPPGSYFAFTNKKPHTTRCEPGGDCMLFSDVQGPWDVVPSDKMAATGK